MELIWNERNGARVVYCGVAQALVEGEVPQLQDRLADTILSATGDVVLLGLETAEGCVRMGGEIRLQLICQDASGVFAFTSRAAFRHTVQTEGVATGMLVRGVPALQSMEVQLSDGRITLHAVADITLRVVDHGPVKALCGLEGVPDLEMQCQNISLPKREEVFREVLPIREEVDAPGVEAVLQRDVLIALRDIQPGEQGTELSGSLTLSALVQDQEGRLFQLHQNIPFTENLEVRGEAEYRAELALEEIRVRAAPEFGLVVVEGRLKVCLYAVRTWEAQLPQDLFSPSTPFSCQQETLRLSGELGPVNHRHTLHETVNIPSGMPEAQRVVYCAVRPVITAAAVNQERLCMEGLLVTRILYEGAEGNIYAFTEDIPFETDYPAPDATEAMVSAGATAIASGSGRALEVSYTLQIQAELSIQQPHVLVTGVTECERPELAQGIVVYFAGAGETLYDVAKRFAIPRSALRAALGDAKEELEEGQRLVFLR